MAMAGVVEAHMLDVTVEGDAVVPPGYRHTLPSDGPAPHHVDVIEGGHPLPTTNSARAGERLLQRATACTDDDVLLVLLSGGGTALVSSPAGALHTDDLRTTYKQLLEGGVSIHDANIVRKHLTTAGGGQLTRAAAPASVRALVLSDVPGNDLSTIASGPTVPDPSTYADALRVLYRNGLWHTIPEAVRTHLADGAHGRIPDTPDASHDAFQTSETVLLGTNQTALDAAASEAQARGYRVAHIGHDIQGEARAVGANWASRVLDTDVQSPTCWLWGGETTVTVTGSGIGGRNQEVALGAAQVLEGARLPVVVLSGGTDGIDGPTDAAGAWATPMTIRRAREQGLDPDSALARNDAYPVFDALDALLQTGPTHTNVMDLGIALCGPS